MGEAMDTTKKRSWCLPCINEGAGTGGSKRFQKFCENSTKGGELVEKGGELS
jgi:hypothetical protein